MEPVRFFYSTDGTDTNGPVTEEELRTLVQNRVVGMSSFLYRDGETTWRPFDPEGFQPPIQIPRLPPYEPPPYVPTALAKAKAEALAEQLVAKKDEGPYPNALKIGCASFAATAAILLAIWEGGIYGLGPSFAAGLLFIGFLPFAISRVFPLIWRTRACAIGMAVMVTLVVLGQVSINQLQGMESSLPPATNGVQQDTPKQIVHQGSPDGNIPQADSNLQKTKDVASQDNSESARMLQAASSVSQVMVEKVKISQAAEDACGSFDPTRFQTPADLNTLRENISKLRDTQVDVLTYFQNYDTHMRAALADGGFSAGSVDQFIASARQQGRIDQAIAVWQLKIKLSDDHVTRLDFLDKHWGRWTPKDGQLIFNSRDDLAAYNALTQDLIDDVKTGRDLQNQVVH